MNPPEISTPETENPPEERAVSRTAWRLGPLGVGAMVVLVLADLFVTVLVPDRQTGTAVLLGLSFGQVGAMILIASAARKLTWEWLIACYAATLIMCIHFAVFQNRISLNEFAFQLTIWGGYTTVALATIQGLRWYRQRVSHTSIADAERVQFGVRHLLVLMTIVAGVSLIVQYAIPLLVDINLNHLWLTAISAGIVVGAVELCYRSHHLFWQLGGLAAMGVVACVVHSQTVDASLAVTAITVQVAVLALVMAVLELETMVPIGETDNGILVRD